MLTAMILKGETEKLAAYHCRGENYYFKQAGPEEEKIYELTGEFPRSDEQLEYVRVHGELADPLGFTPGQTINEEQFNYLLEGQNRDGEQVTQKHKVKGIDLTFSAPKSVSIVGLLLDKNPKVIRAHDEAVREVMLDIEKGFAMARPTATTQWTTGKMVYAAIRDGYSREHDPHLHTHVVLMNITQYQGKFMGLWTRKILQRDFNKRFGAMYRVKLAAKLHSLGYNMTYFKNGEWRLDKVSLAMEQEFSRRAEQIAEAKAAGAQGMDAWRKTRAEKNPAADKKEILKDWVARIKRYVVDEIQNAKDILFQRGDWAKRADRSLEAVQELEGVRGLENDTLLWKNAIARATEKCAIVSKNDLVNEYLKEYMRTYLGKDLSAKEIDARLAEQIRQGFIMVQREKYTERYTSAELASAERHYIRYAGALGKLECYTDGQEAALYIKNVNEFNRRRGRNPLSDMQGRAVYDLITSKRMVDIVQGDAGAGKTTSLKAVAEFYRQQGVDVFGVAVSGAASKNLGGEAGIDSMTMKAFLGRKDLPAGKVIIFDEASMLDSRSAAKLLEAAHKNGDRVILVGDMNQLESIDAGRVFERFIEHYSREGKLVAMTENYRQRNPVLRKAVDLAKQGRMEDSLETLREDGRVTEIESPTARRGAIAGLYSKDTLLIVSTVAARDEVNEKVRENLQAAGQLQGGREYTLNRADKEGIDHPRTIELAPGDVICFTENEYKKYEIKNGEKATVLECGEGVLKVCTEDKRELDINTEEYRDIDYGYALTTYKAQGQTYNRVIIEADSSIPVLADMRNEYVNITRCRDEIKIFTDNFEDLKELAGVRTHATDTFEIEVEQAVLDKALTEQTRVIGNIRPNIIEQNRQSPGAQLEM